MAIDLVLVVEAPPGQVFAQAHNGNADTLGPWGVLVGARTSGHTPLQESTTLGLYSAIEPRKQVSAQFDTQALLGDGGLKGRIGAAWSRARPGEELEPLEIESKTGFLVAELSAPLQVRRGLVTFWRAGIEALEQETTFFGGVPLGDDSLRVAFLGTRTDGLLRNGAWSLDLQARRGLDALGAMRPGDPDASRADADPQAFLLRADGSIVARRDRGGFWGRGGFDAIELMPGDTVVIPAMLDRESRYNFLIRAAKDWTQILANLGLGTAALKTLRN